MKREIKEVTHIYKNQEFRLIFEPFDKIKVTGVSFNSQSLRENSYLVTIFTMIEGQRFTRITNVSYEFVDNHKDYLDFICGDVLFQSKYNTETDAPSLSQKVSYDANGNEIRTPYLGDLKVTWHGEID